MTSAVRRAAGILTLLESFWLLYLAVGGPLIGSSCSGGVCPNLSSPTYFWAVVPLGVVLLIMGALALWGASFAYPAGAIVSAVSLLLMIYSLVDFAKYSYLSAWSPYLDVGAALTAAATICNFVGMRSTGSLSEQVHPLNLPVFG